MTPHLHSEFVEGCYRCDLSRDEEASALERRLPEVERSVVYSPQPGDVVLLEVGNRHTMQTIDYLKLEAQEVFGHDVKIVVLAGAHFAGVMRAGKPNRPNRRMPRPEPERPDPAKAGIRG